LKTSAGVRANTDKVRVGRATPLTSLPLALGDTLLYKEQELKLSTAPGNTVA